MTLQYLLRLFQQRKPKHLRVAVLLDKPERRIAAVHRIMSDFHPNEFVVGYGLDYASVIGIALRRRALLGPVGKKNRRKIRVGAGRSYRRLLYNLAS